MVWQDSKPSDRTPFQTEEPEKGTSVLLITSEDQLFQILREEGSSQFFANALARKVSAKLTDFETIVTKAEARAAEAAKRKVLEELPDHILEDVRKRMFDSKTGAKKNITFERVSDLNERLQTEAEDRIMSSKATKWSALNDYLRELLNAEYVEVWKRRKKSTFPLNPSMRID